MQRKKIFNKKSKSIYIIKLFLIILFLLIIIFYLYYKYTRYNFFIIPHFEEIYYIIPKDKEGKKIFNKDKYYTYAWKKSGSVERFVYNMCKKELNWEVSS